MAILCFTNIVQIIAIIGNNWINWVQIDTVKAALMQSTMGLMLTWSLRIIVTVQ